VNFSVTQKSSYLELRFHALSSGNALSLAAARELASIASKNRKWRKPVAVFSDHRSLFCSGGNLSDYARLKGKAPGLRVNREIEKCLKAFAAWPCVKLACVEGDVFGGGVEWLGYFDYRWMTPYARVAFWQRRIGLTPGWGGGRVWSSLIGESSVRSLLLDSRLLGASECLRLGVADRVVTSWKMLDEVERWALRLGGEEVAAVLRWSSARESSAFAGLWHGPVHRRALEKWK
jgi:enoyl-CoA hydratase/carnithine racemase